MQYLDLEHFLRRHLIIKHRFAQDNKLHQDRTYRKLVNTEKLKTFQVVVQETDLLVHAEKRLAQETRELVLEHRGYVEAYIKANQEFMTTLDPWRYLGPAPNIISDMINAGAKAGVGPMAAIAGAIAETVGRGPSGPQFFASSVSSRSPSPSPSPTRPPATVFDRGHGRSPAWPRNASVPRSHR